MNDDLELDFDRFEYVKVRTLSGEVHYTKVGCRHRNVEPVRNIVTGEPVANICLDCNDQLPVIHGRWTP